MSMYAVITEWEDGTVAVTAVVSKDDFTREKLDRACWLVAREVEGTPADEGGPCEDEITRSYDPDDPGQLPHYTVRADSGDGGDSVYVQEMGRVMV